MKDLSLISTFRKDLPESDPVYYFFWPPEVKVVNLIFSIKSIKFLTFTELCSQVFNDKMVKIVFIPQSGPQYFPHFLADGALLRVLVQVGSPGPF